MGPMKKKTYAVAVCKKGYYLDDLRSKIFTVIKNGHTYWVGDPFPIEVDGSLYIFGEIYEYATRTGRIGYTKLENDKFTKWKVVIREPYHLSFPNLFYIGDTLYMCPESNEAKEIYLYRCVSFPEKWEKDKVLLKGGHYCDTIFIENNGEKYGLTFNLKGMNIGTFEFFKISDEGIVFSDGYKTIMEDTFSRPAGKAIYDERLSKLIVPYQIGKPTYGAGMVLKEVNINWPNYEEKEIKRLYPNDVKFDRRRNYIGMHTLNITDKYVVIDVIWNRFSLIEALCRAILFVKRRISRVNKVK